MSEQSFVGDPYAEANLQRIDANKWREVTCEICGKPGEVGDDIVSRYHTTRPYVRPDIQDWVHKDCGMESIGLDSQVSQN